MFTLVERWKLLQMRWLLLLCKLWCWLWCLLWCWHWLWVWRNSSCNSWRWMSWRVIWSLIWKKRKMLKWIWMNYDFYWKGLNTFVTWNTPHLLISISHDWSLKKKFKMFNKKFKQQLKKRNESTYITIRTIWIQPKQNKKRNKNLKKLFLKTKIHTLPILAINVVQECLKCFFYDPSLFVVILIILEVEIHYFKQRKKEKRNMNELENDKHGECE